MKRLFIIFCLFCFPFVLLADEVDLESLVFDYTKPGDNIGYLKDIDGNILVSYPKGNCKLHNHSTLAIVSLFGRQSLFDYRGEIFSYETIERDEGLYVVSDSKKYGVVDATGKILVPIVYDSIDIQIDNNHKPKAVVHKNGKAGLWDIETNSLILPIDYNAIGNSAYDYATTMSGYYLVSKNGKYGLIDTNLRNITPFKYDQIYISSNLEYSYYDHKREEWVGLNYTKIQRDGKWGILNTVSGKEMLPCIYDEISLAHYTSDLFVCKKEDKWGCVNHHNNVIIPFRYNILWDYGGYIPKEDTFLRLESNGDILARSEKETSIFDSKGKLKRQIPEFIEAVSAGNYLLYQKNGKVYLIDYTMSKITSFDGSLIKCDKNYLIIRNINDSYSLFNIKTQKKIIESAVSIEIFYYEKQTYAIWWNINYNNGNHCIMNLTTHRNIMCPGYFYFTEFEYGMCKCGRDGKYGIVDINGNIIIPLEYENDGNSGLEITENLIFVREIGVFDHNGKLLLSGDFSSMKEIEDNYYNDKYLEVLYKSVQNESKTLIELKKYNKNTNDYQYGYYTYDGEKINELLPCTFGKEDAAIQICHYFNKVRQSDTDTDINIPINRMQQSDLFAVIIANEDYSEANVENVQFAKKDGAIFKEYCQKTLGIPSQNIRYRENATLNNIRAEVNWISDIAKAYNGNAKIIFYYSGHGIPDEKDATSYLLPVDGFGSDARTAYSVSELYSRLGEIPSKMTTVFMDACFSGTKRDGDMMVSARGVAIKAKPASPKGNMVVFSAAQGDQTAYAYRKKKHGMFTYFLLKKLQETNGELTLGELGNYITEQVMQSSLKENGKLQTPCVTASPEIADLNKITLR